MSDENSLQHNSNDNIADQEDISFNNHSQNILEKVNEDEELVEFDMNKIKKIEEVIENE